MILTCKQVCKALAEFHYRDLNSAQRWMLKFHVGICFLCGRFNKDIMIFQDTARAFREHEDQIGTDTRLPEDARQRIRDALKSSYACPET